jgi:hypothetical protein
MHWLFSVATERQNKMNNNWPDGRDWPDFSDWLDFSDWPDMGDIGKDIGILPLG